ncbi:hypothetical protein [Marinobacterium litorale]|uniref:hypothetical protein n=1 Tax=Marinobacterium litorale TaxID=404770 RepID=UPI00040AB3A7|nr:hypothetical protein [Marinobacterium litorale]
MSTPTQQFHDSLQKMLWDASQASMAIKAVSEMMREYTTNKSFSHDVIDHIDSGMWLCGELSDHQKNLVDRVERSLELGRLVGRSESASEARMTFSESLAESATAFAPEDA